MPVGRFAIKVLPGQTGNPFFEAHIPAVFAGQARRNPASIDPRKRNGTGGKLRSFQAGIMPEADPEYSPFRDRKSVDHGARPVPELALGSDLDGSVFTTSWLSRPAKKTEKITGGWKNTRRQDTGMKP